MKDEFRTIAHSLEALTKRDLEERQAALEYIAEAWNAAEDDGVEKLALADASLFAALTMLVRRHGESATADIIAMLPERVRAGDYTIDRQLQ